MNGMGYVLCGGYVEWIGTPGRRIAGQIAPMPACYLQYSRQAAAVVDGYDYLSSLSSQGLC